MMNYNCIRSVQSNTNKMPHTLLFILHKA
eukprot:COSAG01_NODE_3371_length_6179_cov_1.762336_8_plen_28_part_01